MILIHKESLTNKDIKFNWGLNLNTWVNPLTSLLESDYTDDLVSFIEQKYKSPTIVYPKKFRIFNTFKHCNYDDLKLVFISNNPPISEYASGIGFGLNSINTDPHNIPVLLKNFKKLIKNSFYNNISGELPFDNGLQELAEKGVLFLNTSLTVEANENHKLIWKNFVRNVIHHISSAKKDIVFVFLNNENDYFEKYIDSSKHYIYKNENPILDPSDNILCKVDDILDHKYKTYNTIDW